MDRSERFYQIDQLLNEHTVVPMTVFLEEMEVSLATLKRDLEYLRSRFGAPIKWDAERRGYFYEDPPKGEPRFSLPGLWLNSDEIQALLLLESLLSQMQPSLLRSNLAPFRDRLEGLLVAGHVTRKEVGNRIRILKMPSRAVDPRRFQKVCAATVSRRRLKLVYYNHSNGEETRRIVSPQRVVYYRANWYLDAWCHLRKGLRSFALDAIRGATILPGKAREVPYIVLDKHLGVGYGIYAGPARNKAVLRFTPAAARWVARERWHVKQQQRYEPTGFLVLTIPYSRDEELVMDILRYGGDVEVLKPATLRSKVEAALTLGLRNYQSSSGSSKNTAPQLTT